MRQHLNVLLEARTAVEMKILHDRLRRIRSEANMNNVYGSSMQVNITMRAGADYIDNYSKGALDDYKRVVNVDPGRFKQDYLNDFESDFVVRMEQEVKAVRDLVDSAVGGMIAHHGDPQRTWMQNYERPSSLAMKWIASEVALFNLQLLDSKPKFSTRRKDWWEDKPSLVLLGYFLGGAAALATIKAAYDIVAGLIDGFACSARLSNHFPTFCPLTDIRRSRLAGMLSSVDRYHSFGTPARHRKGRCVSNSSGRVKVHDGAVPAKSRPCPTGDFENEWNQDIRMLNHGYKARITV